MYAISLSNMHFGISLDSKVLDVRRDLLVCNVSFRWVMQHSNYEKQIIQYRRDNLTDTQ